MPVVEGLTFRYALHELPPGRAPFRRWRWELWHGARLEAAGWRFTERDAARALRGHAARVGHEMFGLRPPETDRLGDAPVFLPGTTVRVQAGAVAFALVPRHLELAPGALAPG